VPYTYDLKRWVANKDGTYTRVAGGSINDAMDATEGALELAAAYGVDLSEVEGTGSRGRIIKADVEAYLEGDEED